MILNWRDKEVFDGRRGILKLFVSSLIKIPTGDYVKLDDQQTKRKVLQTVILLTLLLKAKTGETGADGKLTFNVGTGKSRWNLLSS